MNMQDRLLEWADMAQNLKSLRLDEAELRQELCAEIIADQVMSKGRVTVDRYEPDIMAKAVQSLTYKLDDKALKSIWGELSEAEKLAVEWKPKLSLTVYKKLPEDSILHDVVTTSLAMPTLKVTFND